MCECMYAHSIPEHFLHDEGSEQGHKDCIADQMTATSEENCTKK